MGIPFIAYYSSFISGSVKSGNVVWNFADTVMAVMAIINLVAIVLLSPDCVDANERLSASIKRGERA